MLDIHCASILMEFYAGEITREEAVRRMREHEDKLLFDMFQAGFKATSYITTTV